MPVIFKRLILYIVIGGSLAVLVISGTGCKNRLLFHPYKQMVATPAAIGLQFEDAYFNTNDGVRLNGWWVPQQGARGTVLFCHGNAGNISFLLDTIQIFRKLKLNVFVFDYRGYGRSGDTPSEEGTYRDAAGAWDFLVVSKKIDARSIIVIGRSLGGPIAAWLCRSRTPRALVLESTFTSAADVADYYYNRLKPGRLVFGNTYDAASYVKSARCPVMVMHSPDDEIIPYSLGEKLFATAPEPKRFLVIRGSHNSGFIQSREQYTAGIDKLLSQNQP